MQKSKHKFKVGDYIGIKIGKGLTYYGTIKKTLVVGAANQPAYVISGFGDPVTEQRGMFKSTAKNRIDKEVISNLKKPSKSTKMATKKRTTKKPGLGRALCTRRNVDGSTTQYSPVNGTRCSYGGTLNGPASVAKKKPAKKRTSATKLCRQVISVPGINKRTGHLLKGWHYVNGKPQKVKAAAKKPTKAKSKATGKAKTAAKKIRKHQGINQSTGRLKKGWRYDGKGGIVKAAAKK